MDCLTVRDSLPEHALGTLPAERAAFVDRHLEWCAGCRKEAAELRDGAAGLGYAIPQAEPPSALEDRVVGTVRRAAGAGAPWGGRLRLLSTATAAALVLALIGVAWGAAMFSRAHIAQARLQNVSDKARSAQQQAESLAQQIQKLLNSFVAGKAPTHPRGPSEHAVRSQLAPTHGRPGGGGAVVFTSPSTDDWALVIVGGLPKSGLPYHVVLRDPSGSVLRVGKIERLDPADGSARVWREFRSDLRRYSDVIVRDRTGAPALDGSISGARPVATTAP